jgi:hypothetical protein
MSMRKKTAVEEPGQSAQELDFGGWQGAASRNVSYIWAGSIIGLCRGYITCPLLLT